MTRQQLRMHTSLSRGACMVVAQDVNACARRPGTAVCSTPHLVLVDLVQLIHRSRQADVVQQPLRDLQVLWLDELQCVETCRQGDVALLVLQRSAKGALVKLRHHILFKCLQPSMGKLKVGTAKIQASSSTVTTCAGERNDRRRPSPTWNSVQCAVR